MTIDSAHSAGSAQKAAFEHSDNGEMLPEDRKPANPFPTIRTVTTMFRMRNQRGLKRALKLYVYSSARTSEIAARLGCSTAAISYWARKFDLPMRKRGRRVLAQPTPFHKEIIAVVRAHGSKEAVRRLGISRQRVHVVLSKWAPELIAQRKGQTPNPS